MRRKTELVLVSLKILNDLVLNLLHVLLSDLSLLFEGLVSVRCLGALLFLGRASADLLCGGALEAVGDDLVRLRLLAGGDFDLLRRGHVVDRGLHGRLLDHQAGPVVRGHLDCALLLVGEQELVVDLGVSLGKPLLAFERRLARA